MTNAMIFLHVLGSLALGFYIVLPFVVGRVNSLSLPAQEGTVSAVRTLNRFGQYGLILQFLTGGYLISKADYSTTWIVVVIVLFLAAGALSGIIGKPLRLAVEGIRAKNEVTDHIGKVRTLSSVLAIVIVVIVYFMVFRFVI